MFEGGRRPTEMPLLCPREAVGRPRKSHEGGRRPTEKFEEGRRPDEVCPPETLLRPMTKGAFNFVTLRLMERHNQRVVHDAAAKAARQK